MRTKQKLFNLFLFTTWIALYLLGSTLEYDDAVKYEEFKTEMYGGNDGR